ncbi:MAG TPA: LmeA family phospholipid-binding protein [Solirubrobacteraceae bacterium]|nr:LmeA family phospholipid-binding protein [Solirubrobacteraceae bacterium]
MAGGVVLALVLSQLLLPRLAASMVSSRVGRYGKVESVSVHAWPALKMAWGSVDSVRVRAKSLTLSSAQAAKLLREAHGVARMDMFARRVRVGALQLSDATLSKRGDALTAQASASDADVKAALPPGLDMQLLRSEHGEVEVLASGGLFGVGASVKAIAQATDGRLVARPLGFLIGGLHLTLFADEHVYVEGVAASVRTREPLSYRVSMNARLR